MARQISIKDDSAKLFYRKCLYGLAMDIGAKKEIFDKFNQSMFANSLSAANMDKILSIIGSREEFIQEPRQITMLSVFNELEKINVYSIPSYQYQGLEKILKSAGCSECSKLADKFMNEVKAEGDLPYETEKGKNKPLCIFIRNETLGYHWKDWEGLLGYIESQEYMETLRKRGIDVREVNNFLYDNFWDGLREKLRADEPVPYDDILIIMIGYSSPNPIPGMFMMNKEKSMNKDIECFDIIADLYNNLIKQFQGKNIFLVSITLPVGGDYHDLKFKDFKKTTFTMPRNFAYLHLHVHDNKSMAKLFKEDFTDSWVNNTDMLIRLKENIKQFNPQIETISFDSTVIISSEFQSEFQRDGENNTELKIKNMLIYKIKVNGCNLNNCKLFTKELGERSSLYHVMGRTLKFENGKINQDSQNKLEKQFLHDANSDISYDFYTFAICCGEKVPNHFYEVVVQACYSALDKAGHLSKPKLIIIDAALEEKQIFEAPTIHAETMILISYSKSDREEDSLLPVLTYKLQGDLFGNYDLLNYLVQSIYDNQVKHANYFDSKVTSRVYLV